MAYLDETGLSHLWEKIKSKIKAQITEQVQTTASFTISHSGTWESVTVNNQSLVRYKQAVTTVYDEHPDITLGVSSGAIPTEAEQKAYALLSSATIDSSVPCLYLYATSKPAADFVINVKGVK